MIWESIVEVSYRHGLAELNVIARYHYVIGLAALLPINDWGGECLAIKKSCQVVVKFAPSVINAPIAKEIKRPRAG